MRACLLALTGAAAFLSACTAGGVPARNDGGGPRDAGPVRPDTGAGMDAGARTCAAVADCDDGHACTVDQCAVGGLCRYTPLDEMCPDGQRCSPAAGCTTGCATPADCDDRAFCNGVERCIAGDCFMGDAVDCDDGNACTVDACDPAEDGCVYEVAAGCDAGSAGTDAGVPCDPFDPATHYAGTFRMLPGQSSSCFAATYSVSEVRFSVSGGTLTVTADRFPLAQMPVPAGPSFRVTYAQSDCNRYELEGTFTCADRFTGTWRTSPSGSCSMCSGQNAEIIGIRR